MANAIGTAYIKIMPDASGISGKINREITPGVEAAGTAGGKKWVGAFKKVLAGAAIGKWVGGSVLAGADLEQSIGGIETLYKEASGKMMQYASQAYKTAGVDANTYMQQATSFSAALIKSYNGDVDKAADATNQAMIDMADNANKMGTPLESISQAYLSFSRGQFQLLDNLKLGYGGTKTEMERLLQDAQKITGVKYDINNLNDIYDAIHVIQTEMGITGTTQEEAAKTISGSIGMVKASYRDLIANLALGNDVWPQIRNLASSTITMLGNVLPAIGRVVIGVPSAIISHFPEIKAAIQTTITNALAAFRANFPKWRAAVVENITNAGSTIIQNIPTILSKIGQLIKSGISLIKQYMPSIMSAVGLILANLLKTLVKNIPAILRTAFNLAKTIIKGAFSLIKAIVTGAFTAFKTMVSTLFSNVIGKTREKFNSIRTLVGEKIQSIKDKITNGVASIKDRLTKPFTDAKDTIKGIIDKVKGFFPLSLGKIFSGIKLPHFKISGGKIPWGIGGAGTAPSVGIEWYSKGGILTKPTLFGGGEAGAEAIMPLDPFWDSMDRIVDGINNSGGVTINVYGTPGMDVNELANVIEQKIIQMQKRRTLAWQ